MTLRGLVIGAVVAVLPGTLFGWSDVQVRDRSTAMTVAREEALSPDVIPFISRPEVSMAVVVASGTEWERRVEQGLEMEVGRVRFEVVSPIHGDLSRGQLLHVPAKRVVDPTARVRHNFDAWNTLALTRDEEVILALAPGSSPQSWIGVAAMAVHGVDASEVRAVRQAYEIESTAGNLRSKAGRLHEALLSDEDVLLFFALDHLRRHAADRAVATSILTGAVDAREPSDLRLELARALVDSPFLKPEAGADSENRRLVASLANGLVQETDEDRRVDWAQLLASSVLIDVPGDEAQKAMARAALTSGAGLPAAEQVIAAVTLAQQTAPPDARPTLENLIRVWRSR